MVWATRDYKLMLRSATLHMYIRMYLFCVIDCYLFIPLFLFYRIYVDHGWLATLSPCHLGVCLNHS